MNAKRPPDSTYPVVILGAGLTGLSTAFHLEDVSSLILERESEVGGLCRTHEEAGFTFDCTGHLLHLKTDEVRDLVKRLLPDTFTTHERRAQIFSKGVFTSQLPWTITVGTSVSKLVRKSSPRSLSQARQLD